MAENPIEVDPYIIKCMKEMRDRQMAHNLLRQQWEKEDLEKSKKGGENE